MKRIFISLAGLFAGCAPVPKIEGTPVASRAVLVHGIFEDGTKFRKIQRRLESHGIQCIAPKLQHQDGTGGLDFLAERLKDDIDGAFGPDKPIIVIGFSMGGLVSRYYLQKLGGAERCVTFITISSPHHGTNTAWTYPSKGSIQMRPRSEFLGDLADTEHRLGDIPVISYRTPMDLMIVPAKSSIWRRAENIEFPVAIHPMMLQSEEVIADIERRLVR